MAKHADPIFADRLIRELYPPERVAAEQAMADYLTSTLERVERLVAAGFKPRTLELDAVELNARTLNPNEGLNGNRKTRRARRAMLARALRNNVKKIERREARRKPKKETP